MRAIGSLLTGILLALAVPALLLALLLLTGAGVLRQGSPVAVAAASVLLVGLPVAGVALLVPWRALGVAIGALAWSMALIGGFPLFFPGERAAALAAGIGIVTGLGNLRLPPSIPLALDRLLPVFTRGTPTPPTAEPGDDGRLPASEPASTLLPAGSVVLPYEGSGGSLSIPVLVEGPRGTSAEVWMLFDTGATLTTLDRATLAAIGIDIPDDAPRINVRTAAGERRTPVVLVDKVWVGGIEVDGVTVGVCDRCAADDQVGLLGLNVSGRFKVTVDTSRREITLRARSDAVDRVLDVAPWLLIRATATRWGDGRTEVEVAADNSARREVSRARVAIRCGGTWIAELRAIPSGGSAAKTVSLPLGAHCDGYTVKLDGADW